MAYCFYLSFAIVIASLSVGLISYLFHLLHCNAGSHYLLYVHSANPLVRLRGAVVSIVRHRSFSDFFARHPRGVALLHRFLVFLLESISYRRWGSPTAHASYLVLLSAASLFFSTMYLASWAHLAVFDVFYTHRWHFETDLPHFLRYFPAYQKLFWDAVPDPFLVGNLHQRRFMFHGKRVIFFYYFADWWHTLRTVQFMGVTLAVLLPSQLFGLFLVSRDYHILSTVRPGLTNPRYASLIERWVWSYDRIRRINYFALSVIFFQLFHLLRSTYGVIPLIP